MRRALINVAQSASKITKPIMSPRLSTTALATFSLTPRLDYHTSALKSVPIPSRPSLSDFLQTKLRAGLFEIGFSSIESMVSWINSEVSLRLLLDFIGDIDYKVELLAFPGDIDFQLLELRGGFKYTLIESIPDDHLRKILDTPKKINQIIYSMSEAALSSLLLKKLGKDHISKLYNTVDELVNCWNQVILDLLTSEKLRSMVNTFEGLEKALAWSSKSSWDQHKSYSNGFYLKKLIDSLGSDYVVSLIPNGKELAALCSEKWVVYGDIKTEGRDYTGSRINSKILLEYVSDSLAEVPIHDRSSSPGLRS